VTEFSGFDTQSAARLGQTLMLGLSKSPLPDAAPPPLAALSLLSVWKSCAEPALQKLERAGERIGEKHSFLGDASRRALIRLLAGKKPADGDEISRAAIRAVRMSGLALHPFDHARLEDALARHAGELNAAERAWLSAVRPERELPEAAYDGPPVGEENLAEAGKLAKLGFLRQLRADNPSRARELIAGLFVSEPAAMRGELLAILAAQPVEEDALFLLDLANDRAATVREAAERILGRIRGTGAFAKRMDRLKERLAVKTEGLILRKKVLAFSMSASAKPHEILNEQSQLLEGLRLEDIAQALGESEKSLLEIAARSDKLSHVALLLLVKAVDAGKLDIAVPQASLLDDEDGKTSVEFLSALAPVADLEARRAISEFALRPERWTGFPPYGSDAALLSFFSGPAHEAMARRLLAMPAFSRAEPPLQEAQLNLFAPLFPASLSGEFIVRFGDAAPRAAQYHQFLQTLTAAAT
jgi:Family of unknown function (DUF5691)